MVPGFRDATSSYAAALEVFAQKLVQVYAVALGLDRTYFDAAAADPLWRLRLSHYPATGVGTKGFGIAPHVDTSFFTLLAQDSVAGLVLARPDGSWRRVPATQGGGNPAASGGSPPPLLCNTGELLRMWSNDRFRSARHYVLPTLATADSRSRYSMPFFFNVDAEYVMECLPTCCSAENPPKYKPMSYLESQGVAQGE